MLGFRKRSIASLSSFSVLISLAVVSPIGIPTVTAQNESPAGDNWKVGRAVLLPVTDIPKEVSASAAPDDPDRLLICTFEKDGEHARHHSAAYLSLDGGAGWMKTLDDPDSDWVSETSCAAGANGAAYFVVGASDASRGEPRHETGTAEFFRSLDGGLHWMMLHRYPFIDWTMLAVSKGSDSPQESIFLYGSKMAQGVGDAGVGSWMDVRGPLLVSRDGAQTFSPPVYPDDKAQKRTMGTYPISAIVVKTNSILTLFAQGPNPDQFAVYRTDDGVYEWESTIHIPQGMEHVGILSSQMALDHDGKYPGRLYVVFPARMGNQAVLGLAISDDKGKTWRTSVLLRRDARPIVGNISSGFAGVAVNRDGVVGVEWLPSDGCPLFAVSTDGGDSVAELHPLGVCRGRDAAESQPLALPSRMDALNMTSVRDVPGSDKHRLGFWMRVDTTPLWGVHITADTAGRFHAIWAETLADGAPALFTTSISTGTSSPQVISLEGGQDLTEHSLVKVLEEKFDPYTSIFNIDAVVKNVGLDVLSYPSVLEVSGGLSDCGNIKYLNPSAISKEGQTLFRVPVAPYTDRLSPGETTLPIHMEIEVKGCESSNGSLFERSRIFMRDRDWFYTLSVSFRVYVLKEAPRFRAYFQNWQRN
jgi:hypothetical protein